MILLVVDMQKGLVDKDLYAYDTFIDRTSKLVYTAREKGVEVIFFIHDDGTKPEIIDRVKPLKNERVYYKTINSCFGNKDFKKYMSNQKDKRLMIIGLQTNYCIDATIKSAFEKGFDIIVPEGTNSTFDNKYMNAETTVRYYNEDVWEGVVELVSFEEAIRLLQK